MRKLTLIATAMAVGGLAACGQAAPSTAAADATSSDCGTGPISSSLARTASYEFTAAAGELEATYTKAQVDAQHPTSGEMMLGGHLTDVPGMPMGGAGSGMHNSGPTGPTMPGPGLVDPGYYRHVEVHSCNRTSGKVIQHASPDLILIARSAHDTAQHLPVAVMQGVHSGVGDMHSGNNAHMINGHRYTLDVTMTGEHAQFNFGTGQ